MDTQRTAEGITHADGPNGCIDDTESMDDARVPDYLRVFYLLHTSGLREAAGVPAR